MDSTNSWARQEARQGARDGGIYLTDYQSAGRGRRGRAWEVPAGTSVMFSILLKPETAPENLSMLTLDDGARIDAVPRVMCFGIIPPDPANENFALNAFEIGENLSEVFF